MVSWITGAAAALLFIIYANAHLSGDALSAVYSLLLVSVLSFVISAFISSLLSLVDILQSEMELRDKVLWFSLVVVTVGYPISVAYYFEKVRKRSDAV